MYRLIPIILAVLFLNACFHEKRIRGNGTIKTETRQVSGFTGIDVSGNFDVYLKQDSVSSVRIEADENLLEYIRVTSESNTLVIDSKNHTNLRGTRDIKIYISL